MSALQVETLTLGITGELTAEQMAETIRTFTREALAEISSRREESYKTACAPLDQELDALTSELARIEASEGTRRIRLAATERVAAFELDKLIAEGKDTEEKQKELNGIRALAANMEVRRGEIAERCRQIATEKADALRSVAVEFRDASILLIRANESALSTTLDAATNILGALEGQLERPLCHPNDLTADEKTSVWTTLRRFYQGRVR